MSRAFVQSRSQGFLLPVPTCRTEPGNEVGHLYNDVSNPRSLFGGGGGLGWLLESFGFVRFIMHKFREDREGVARRLKGRQANGKFC